MVQLLVCIWTMQIKIRQFWFYYFLGQSPALWARISLWEYSCSVSFSRSAPGLFQGMEVRAPSRWTPGQRTTCYNSDHFWKEKKSHLIITWPMGAKCSFWYNELFILIGFVIRRESSREQTWNMEIFTWNTEIFSTVTGKGESWWMSRKQRPFHPEKRSKLSWRPSGPINIFRCAKEP